MDLSRDGDGDSDCGRRHGPERRDHDQAENDANDRPRTECREPPRERCVAVMRVAGSASRYGDPC